MSEIKEWQHGYPIEYLKDIEKLYSEDNKLIRSPFDQYKKNTIARDLHEGSLKLISHPYMPVPVASYSLTTSKVKTKISMHGDSIFGIKEKGDLTISNISGDLNYIKRDLEKLSLSDTNNVWLIIKPWQRELEEIIRAIGYDYVGSKINTFSDITLYYFKDNDLSFSKRSHPILPKSELTSMKRIGNTEDSWRKSIVDVLSTLGIEFMNHYSKYNTKDAWSAISLRGYSPDYKFIEKPEEMNEKWHVEHKDQEFFIQDTPIYEKFPMIKEFLSTFNTPIHRVRLMKLSPGGGELDRHTDQVDPEVGTKLGKLARLHFPILTNPGVIFSTWDLFDQKQSYHFGLNEIWYLDTRKPHTAINNGEEDRIHLVVDVEVTQELQKLIE